MKTITNEPLPESSALWQLVQDGDFIDGYSVVSPLTPLESVRAGFTIPSWVKVLMKMRNTIVKPLGIKTGAITASQSQPALFPITYESENELIIGSDDTHLNFRISILRRDGRIHMSTWVHRNNLAGRIYLVVVMPFHILICRNAMHRLAKTAP